MSQNYEKLYAGQMHLLGEALPEVVQYFKSLPAPSRVLDLGAGQGRDAIVIARLGHEVHAVDISPTGLKQLASDGARLKVTTEIADLNDYTPKGEFDVILIDRTLHMIGVDAGKSLLKRLPLGLAEGGEIYVLDEKKNIPLFIDALLEMGFKVTAQTPSAFRAQR